MTKGTIEVSCTYCNQELIRWRRDRDQSRFFCDDECFREWEQGLFDIAPCANCGVESRRSKKHRYKVKSDNIFCTKSCAATYNNKNKKYGTRRSKLEAYVEERIKQDYPTLDCVFNGKEAIGSELDFYFPSLRLAIELNGIVHFEPIFGDDKFNQIKNNDQQKFLACHNAGIQLAIIDSSQLSYFKPDRAEKYYQLVKDLIERCS